MLAATGASLAWSCVDSCPRAVDAAFLEGAWRGVMVGGTIAGPILIRNCGMVVGQFGRRTHGEGVGGVGAVVTRAIDEDLLRRAGS